MKIPRAEGTCVIVVLSATPVPTKSKRTNLMATTTAFTVKTISVGTASPELAPLAGRQYEKAYSALPNANLPKAMRRDLDKVFLALTGEELPLEENTFLIKAEDGVYNRLFGPILKVGSDDVEGTESGSAYIQWGDRYIPVSLGKDGVTVDINGQAVSLESEFAEFNFSGRGNDAALMVSVDEEDGSGQVVLPVAVRFIDWQNPPEIKALNALMKKGKEEEILSFVQEATPKGTGSRQNADHDIDFRDLEEGESYTVTSYRGVNTQYGASYRIILADYPVPGETAECWAHASLRPLLATQPEISAEKPATIHIKDKTAMQDGKVRIRCSMILSAQEEVSDDALDLNF